jgi:hypothetical protein
MSQIVRGILGAIAVTGTLGAAQLALGGDLGQLRLNREPVALAVSQDVNRTGKTDRGGLAQQVQPGQTFAVKLIGQSVLVRIPAERVGAADRTRTLLKPAGPHKSIVACEPVVSVLVDVAKQLLPGRCVV